MGVLPSMLLNNKYPLGNFYSVRKKSDHKLEVDSASKLKHVTQIDFLKKRNQIKGDRK